MKRGIGIVEPKFERADTKAIKGLAVILMLYHHLAAFPDRMPVGFEGFSSILGDTISVEILQAFASASKICVSIFFFLGGYGLFLRWKSSEISITTEIAKLYKAYWKVFLVFIPIGILFFGRNGSNVNPQCSRFSFVGMGELLNVTISDFIGWTCNLNPEWWFFRSYICVIPLGYLFCKEIERNNDVWKDLFVVFGVDILIRSVFPAIAGIEEFNSLKNNLFFNNLISINSYSSCYFAGIVFAKYDCICVIKKQLQSLSYGVPISIVGLCVLFWCRTFIIGGEADIIYCALMIPMLSILLDKVHAMKTLFVFLGKHSANIWLTHSFYCYYFLEITYLIYSTKIIWIDLIILIVLSVVSSVVLEGFYKSLGKWLGKKPVFVASEQDV